MKPLKNVPDTRSDKVTHPSILRGQAAAKLMSKELRAEYKRWNLPLLSWKDGKVVATRP